MFTGNPPYLLELTDKNKLEEFAHLVFAAFLEQAGVQLVTPGTEQPAHDKVIN